MSDVTDGIVQFVFNAICNYDYCYITSGSYNVSDFESHHIIPE